MEVLAQEAYNIGKIKCAENLLKKKGRDFRLFYLFTAEQVMHFAPQQDTTIFYPMFCLWFLFY